MHKVHDTSLCSWWVNVVSKQISRVVSIYAEAYQKKGLTHQRRKALFLERSDFATKSHSNGPITEYVDRSWADRVALL